MSAGGVRIRAGGQRDVDVLLAMFDDAVAWLAARGRGGQWGTRPWSREPDRVRRVEQLAAETELWIAEADGGPAGAIGLGERPPLRAVGE